MNGQPSAYVCASCGRDLPSGARWCPHCHSVNVTFVEREPDTDRVIQVRPPTIVDDEKIWGSADAAQDDRSLFERTNPGLREPLYRKDSSRWQAGVNTFGPAGRIIATLCVLAGFILVLWMSNGFLLILLPLWGIGMWLILRDVWRKDEIVKARERKT